ncbi:hypothetical protein [Henriciella aquimarina]|uniref:hypothetical protein n=1 Tax=Henriciella aquimarina TaxID=545261 RepID=UPI000A0104B0|nr:hypothetical protein [Henriciella aquimarina]
MRHLSLSLAALALAACGSGSVDPDATMPTPHPEGQSGEPSSSGTTEFENSIMSTEMSGSAIEGEWASATVSGNDGAEFTDANGDRQLVVFCQDNGEDSVNQIVMRRYVDEDAVAGDNPSIAVYTSAGSRSYQVNGTPAQIAVSAQDHFANMLGAAKGEIRIVTGYDTVVIPAGELLNTLVDECRPGLSFDPNEPVEVDVSEEDEEDSE